MDPISLNPPHELILQATLLRGEPAASTYAQWKAVVLFDDVDPEAYRFLPSLYRNLRVLQIEDELTLRLRGIYRRTWYANQIARQHYGNYFRALLNAAIDFRLIGGGLSVAHNFGDPGIYPQDDAELLVRSEQIERAGHILSGLGWMNVSSSRNEMTYCKDGRFYLGLHSNIVHGLSLVERLTIETHHWQDATSVEADDLHIPMLNAVDQVLFWIDFGQLGGGWPAIRWLYYTWSVLEYSPAFNWGDLVTQARARHKTQALVGVLSYLKTNLDLPVPNKVFAELSQPSVTDQPMRYDQFSTQRMRISRHWIRHTTARIAARLQRKNRHW